MYVNIKPAVNQKKIKLGAWINRNDGGIGWR
jgi:hypothetical protein